MTGHLLLKLVALLLSLLAFYHNLSWGQNWTRYSTSDGLAGDSIQSLHEDRKGYLWFVTDFSGATRFDGAYFQNLDAAEGLASNNINFTLTDTKGNIWFATDRGVSRFDGHDIVNFDTTSGLCSDYVTCILEDSRGDIWFGTGLGACRFDGKRILTPETTSEELRGNIICLFEDRGNKLWFGTESGIVMFDGQKYLRLGTAISRRTVQVIFEDSRGYVWLGTDQGVFKKEVTGLKIDGPYGEGSIFHIVEEQDGNILFSTDEHGVITYDSASDRFSHLDGLMSSTVFSLLLDSRSHLWLGGDRGISRFDGVRMEHFQEVLGEPSNYVHSILEDSDGNLWFATERGVLKYAEESIRQFTRREGLPSNTIETIAQDRDGFIWFGTDSGLARYKDGSFVTSDPLQKRIDEHILSLLVDRENNLWVGTTSGLFKNFQIFRERDCPLETAVMTMREDRKGNLWFATAGGVCRHQPAATQFFPLEGITTLFLDSDDHLWIGTFNAGVHKYEGGDELISFSMENGLGSNHITWILETHAGHLWIGLKGGGPKSESGALSQGGICRFDQSTFTHYGLNEGLPSDLITAGLEDSEGNLWFGTEDKGVIKCTAAAEGAGLSFQTISAADGLISNHVTAMSSDIEGNLWFATDKGIAKYDGQNSQNISLEPYLTLGSIASLFEDELGHMWFITENNGIIRYAPPAKEIRPRIHLVEIDADKIYRSFVDIKVPMTTPRLTFTFKGISFRTRPEELRYIYMLEGYDPDWRPSTHERRIEYRNVGPGTYRFMVRAIDKDLHYSYPGEIVTVRIFRPFHRNAIFLIFTVLLGMGASGGAGYLILQERRQRKIAAEFKDKLAKQEEAERIQSAKMESLRRLVAGVAHDLNNPLGVITSSYDVSNRGIDHISKIISQKYPRELEENTPLKKTLDLLRTNNCTCQSASERVARIVANIRRFVRLDEGEWQSANVNQCLDNVIDLLEPEIKDRISVKRQYADLPDITCSPSNLNQAFMAVLRNAAEAIPEKGEITILTFSEENDIKVVISDTGIGISQQALTKIFDPGFTTKGVKVGVGLGLSICYKVIVDDHDGHIDVSSAPGKGAVFTISIPMRTEASRSK